MNPSGEMPFPAYSINELHHLPPGHELSKIEEGLDSIVLLWRRKGLPDKVLKYYDSDVTPEMIQRYSEAVSTAMRLVDLDPLSSTTGQIFFSIVRIEETGIVHTPMLNVSVTQCPYIKGIELEAIGFPEHILLEMFTYQMPDLSAEEREAILRFSKAWRQPDSLLKKQVTQRIHEMNKK